jgi:hypothetical protein
MASSAKPDLTSSRRPPIVSGNPSAESYPISGMACRIRPCVSRRRAPEIRPVAAAPDLRKDRCGGRRRPDREGTWSRSGSAGVSPTFIAEFSEGTLFRIEAVDSGDEKAGPDFRREPRRGHPDAAAPVARRIRRVASPSCVPIRGIRSSEWLLFMRIFRRVRPRKPWPRRLVSPTRGDTPGKRRL